MTASQWITVLGSTGSIGQSTLDVIARHEHVKVFALTADRNVGLMEQQCRDFRPRFAVMADPGAATELSDSLQRLSPETRVLSGSEALVEVAGHEEVDCVMAAIVGAAGLLPTLAAAESGKKVLLANKESLIMAGELFMTAVQRSGATILPIDSEHNALFQCLPENARLPGAAQASPAVRRIVLTASGGPFLDMPLARLESVTVSEACKHPNWSMGQKISVDSATMMNKGLELIEACYLFALPAGQVDVLIHPQSIVHSMVEYRDGSVLAQMGSPDMRIPIAYGLAWPERMASGAEFLDLVREHDLQFREPDLDRFPCLALGMEAARQGSAATIALNAANEVAVAAFLEGRIRFTDIPAIIERTMARSACRDAPDVDMIQRLDAEARALADEQLASLSRS